MRIPMGATAAAVRKAICLFVFSSHNALDIKRMNSILTNSLGWKVRPAMGIFSLDPFVIDPRRSTATSAAIPSAP